MGASTRVDLSHPPGRTRRHRDAARLRPSRHAGRQQTNHLGVSAMTTDPTPPGAAETGGAVELLARPRKNVISLSGGKDSVATFLMCRELEPLDSIELWFAETDNEH